VGRTEKDRTMSDNDNKLPTTGPGRAGVMGDGTEEQNLGQPGDPSKRITQEEVEEAFGQKDGPEQA
jgi:hypothetical protein